MTFSPDVILCPEWHMGNNERQVRGWNPRTTLIVVTNMSPWDQRGLRAVAIDPKSVVRVAWYDEGRHWPEIEGLLRQCYARFGREQQRAVQEAQT